MQVMQELSTNGVQPEDWGGDVPMVQVQYESSLIVILLFRYLCLTRRLLL